MNGESVSSREIFDRDAARYDAWFDSADGRLLFESELAAVRLLWRAEFRPALEVGVGTGRFAAALGVEQGVDPAPGALRLAAGRGVRVTEAGGEALPFPDGVFGGVLMIVTLCFARDPAALFREAARVLRADGRLLVGEIPADSPWGLDYLRKKAAGHPFYRHAWFHTTAEVRCMIADAGLEVEGVSSTLGQPPGGPARREVPQLGIASDAGFVCLLARKSATSAARAP